jgi:hypothetical protein
MPLDAITDGAEYTERRVLMFMYGTYEVAAKFAVRLPKDPNFWSLSQEGQTGPILDLFVLDLESPLPAHSRGPAREVSGLSAVAGSASP